jgi:peptide/nickel transport system permease protein
MNMRPVEDNTGHRAPETTSDEYRFLTPRQLMWRKFMRHKVGVAATVIIILLYVMTIFAEFFAPYDKTTSNMDYLSAPPVRIRLVDDKGRFYLRPFVYRRIGARDPKTLRFVYQDDLSTKDFVRLFVHGDEYTMFGLINSDVHFFGVREGTLFLFGTDERGRDLFSRIVFGGRISLTIGIVGVAILMFLGTLLGTISGYYGGGIDNIVQRIIEILRTIPQIALWMALAAAIPPTLPSTYVYVGIVIILGLIGWTGIAREVRGKVLAIRGSDFVHAAEVAGAGSMRIFVKHLIPNISSHVIVSATLSIPVMIIGESSLSFLGLGIKPPMTSWGLLLNQVREVQVLKHFPWLLLPALFIVISVLCFNFMGDALRDVIDPYSK